MRTCFILRIIVAAIGFDDAHVSFDLHCTMRLLHSSLGEQANSQQQPFQGKHHLGDTVSFKTY
jgi:hypothetical protein